MTLAAAAGIRDWTAVSADAMFAANMQAELGLSAAEAARVVIGNWQDRSFLQNEQYDTILADYLIGAVDGFAPYFQVSGPIFSVFVTGTTHSLSIAR